MSIDYCPKNILLRCILCHSIFKLYKHYHKNQTAYSEFECNCGRIIKIKETLQQNTTCKAKQYTEPCRNMENVTIKTKK